MSGGGRCRQQHVHGSILVHGQVHGEVHGDMKLMHLLQVNGKQEWMLTGTNGTLALYSGMRCCPVHVCVCWVCAFLHLCSHLYRKFMC